MSESYPLVFLAWFIGGFVNGVSGMGAAMVALPIMACVMDMSVAVPASCFTALVVATQVAWMYRKSCRYASLPFMLTGCVPGVVGGVLILRVVPGVWLQAFLGVALVAYVCWQYAHRRSAAHPETRTGAFLAGFGSGFANASISFSGPPVAMYALYVGWDKDSARGTLGLFFLCINIITSLVQASAGLFTSEVLHAAMYGMPGAVAGLVASLPFVHAVKEQVFQRILLGMIALAGAICVVRAAETLL